MLATVTALSLISYPGIAYFQRLWERDKYYKLARQRANQLKKPLILVGAPNGGWTKNVCPCGDRCVDIKGCASCGAEPMDVTNLQFENNSSVVYVCCVLELVPNIKQAWNEITRVSGSKENLLVTHLSPFTPANLFYPGIKYQISHAPPIRNFLRYRNNGRGQLGNPLSRAWNVLRF